MDAAQEPFLINGDN